METISNVVNTATKAIWGEQPAAGNETAGTEPPSGVQGKGTATEPYDGGNAVDPTNSTTSNETAGQEPVSGVQGKGTVTEPFDQGNSADATNPTGKDDPTDTTSLPIREKSSETPSKPAIPGDSFNSAAAANASVASHTSDITSTTATGNEAKPLETTEASLSPVHEGAGKPYATPEGVEVDAVKSKKDAAEDILEKRDPAEKKSSTTQGQAGGQEHGAGKEADRLLEEKGIRKDDKGAMDKPDAAGGATGDKEKVSKMGKLKEKLHIGHKH